MKISTETGSASLLVGEHKAVELKEVNYDGYLTLEAEAFLRDYNRETALDGLKKLAELARKIDKIIKNL